MSNRKEKVPTPGEERIIVRHVLRFPGWLAESSRLAGEPAALAAFVDLLHPGEALRITLLNAPLPGGSRGRVEAAVISGEEDDAAIEERRMALAEVFCHALEVAFPNSQVLRGEAALRPLPCRTVVQPAGQVLAVAAHARTTPGPRPLSARAAPARTAAMPGGAEHIGLALARLDALGGQARLCLTLRRAPLEAPQLKRIGDLLKRFDEALPAASLPALLEAFPQWRLLSGLLADADACWLEVAVESADPVEETLCQLLCLGFHGSPLAAAGEEGAAASGAPALHQLLPRRLFAEALLPAVLAAIPAWLTAAGEQPVARQGLLLGETMKGRPVFLSSRDRARHLYIIGATGTGKSTFMANMAGEDMEAGRGVILIDPHGDLVADVERLVPAARREDLLICDMADPARAFSANILAAAGGAPEVERELAIDALLDLLKRVLFPGVPEAFGPMFEAYFRNSLKLLMLAREKGRQTSLEDMARIFSDDTCREELLELVDDGHLRTFWEQAGKVSFGNDISLANISPYITSKMEQITGSRILRPVLASSHSSLDFTKVISEGGICLINLAKPQVGRRNAALVGGVLSIRLAMAAMAQGHLPPQQRRESYVYMDEFQTYASYVLSEMMAESRKYGLRLTLANQTLGQLRGDFGQPEQVSAILGNAANIVTFRLGDADARVLGSLMEPAFNAAALTRLPDFHAVARLQHEGRPRPPLLLRTRPPRIAPDDAS